MALDYVPGRPPLRTWLVPVLATIAGSGVSLLPIVAQSPILPSCGLLMALGWRLLRPEMWGAWVALLLGLSDDLISGAPIGSAMALWTIVFLAFDIADHRRVWRDHWVDWQLAAAGITVCTLGAWAIARFSGGAGPLWTVVPQALLAILAFPAAARLCASIDRWRLGEGAATSV
jgi:rod shape-determining protein MreD